ncbi:hypothetical protein F4604DRAFT_1920108 [Suillus subluteus]|nr:hypothetical protein F4604DRAFT_1920108 [Suillus subluteus]
MPPRRTKCANYQSHRYHLKPYNLRSSPSQSYSSPSSNNEPSSPSGITSDDMFRLEFMTACKELAKANRDKEEACMERDAIATIHQGLLQTVDVALQCQICLMAIETPVTKHVLSNVYPDVPQYFKDHPDPFTCEEVETLCDGRYPILPGRHYECPTCRAFVYDPPVQIHFLRDVVSTFGEAFGPDVKHAEGVQPADLAEWWAVFFKPF